MKHWSLLLLICLFTLSCSHDDEVYPNVITDIASIKTDNNGTMRTLVFDDGTQYNIANELTGYIKNVAYRVLVGYAPTDATSARIYNLTGVNVLRDSTETPRRDPVRLLSQWRTPLFINLHLAPKTQGGKQHWGFIVDSIATRQDAAGDTTRHAYLSLHHNQNGDPTSYTTDVYASIPLDSIKGIDKERDEITVNVISE